VKTFKKIILGTALAATSLTVAAPASAQDYYRYHRHGGDDATAAIVGGVIGLALGAAIASSSNRRYDGYRNGTWYEGYQYRNGGFYDRQGYRRYDRNTWQHRHYQGYRQDGYRGGYDQRDRDDDRDDNRDGYGDQGRYGNGYGSDGYNGGSYNSGGGYYGGGNYPRGY
jgi:hypothetical protein